MHVDRRLLIAFAAGLVLAVSGCGSSNDEPNLIVSPLGVVSTLPWDLPSPPYAGTWPLGVVFTRATGLHEMQVSLFPPTDTGSFTPNSETLRLWTWNDVQFDPDDGCYFWLIDGVKLGRYQNLLDGTRVFKREPIMVRIPSSRDRFPSVGFSGFVTSINPNVFASGTILFILPADSTTFNPLDPGSFDPDEATAIAVAERGDEFVQLRAPYRATMLPQDVAYIVVGITDTNDDLYYSPLDDWWGMYEDDGGLATVISRMDTGDKDSPFNVAVHLILRAPAAVDDQGN